MKIAFTGGGTGGHFYPHIAVAEAVSAIARENRLIEPKLYYLAPDPYDEQALFAANIAFVRIPAGKMRRYFSLRNIGDLFKTFAGIVRALAVLFKLYPDVIFSKGSYASVPVVLAARLLRIPVVAHESDSKPGRATLLAAKSAVRIAVTFESSIGYFPKKVQGKIARTGIPVREEFARPLPAGAREELRFDPSLPVLLILGGSTGSVRINEIVLSALPDLVGITNVIHQTGKENFAEVVARSKVILEGSPSAALASRYRPFPFLTRESLLQAAGAASVVVSRAGATAITEIALWKKPAILIPIPESISHDQRTNAYAYAHTGAAVVLEEDNMTPHILVSEVRRLNDPSLAGQMAARAEGFANPQAARLIAEELMRIGFSHSEPGTAATAG
jgi:UDP-N-acetylglucosamine--N-acetylmuramyl-(pentapeptide) pyrophosphoryl-undecaprenol N-acetylglucosamine transferase